MKLFKLFASLVVFCGLLVPAAAQAQVFVVTDEDTTISNPIPRLDSNNPDDPYGYNSQILAAGFDTMYANAGLAVDQNGIFDFYYVGSRSGYENSFYVEGTDVYFRESYSTYGDMYLHLDQPEYFGSIDVLAGDVTGLFFDSDFGLQNQPLNSDPFGIFVSGSELTGHSSLLFGFDDGGANVNGDYNDMLVLVTFTSAVPEPATWLMMILGFGIVASAARRRRSSESNMPC